jgi:organic radical activating enzyme
MLTDDEYQTHLKQVSKEINDVSPSFCVAKWNQVTMHLHNGHTHSCHHPKTHIIPIEEIKRSPKALHNTDFKKLQRRMMLEGRRPPECDYCWRVEDSGNELSDRVIKSADTSWAYHDINKISNTPWNSDVDPTYVEISFSSVCNFKCSYCGPNVSSQWMEEIERHGPYPTSNKFNNLEWLRQQKEIPIPNNQDNPYVDAFWEWFPDMYMGLKQFRITGGEPLLSKNTFKVLDYIIANPNPNLVFSVNTNLNPPEELLEKFIQKLKIIQENKCIERLHLFTSAEAYGQQAEYIRHGLNYNQWLINLERIVNEVPEVSFTIMSTYNLLSITTFDKFLKDMLDLRLKYRHLAIANHRTPIMVNIPYLRYPDHQAPYIATQEFIPFIDAQIKYMEDNIEEGHIEGKDSFTGFHEHEIYKLKNIRDIVQKEIDNPSKDFTQDRKDFISFVDEHDKRRGTSFLETFPEMEKLYNEWKTL